MDRLQRVGLLALGLAAAALAPRAPAQTAKPHVAREDIEWLDVWLPNTNRQDLPRILLIGDSITRAYGPGVETRLSGAAYVGRMATSKSLGDPALLEQVSLVLREQRFDIIHFNNGLHGHEYTEGEYQAAFPELLATMRKYAPASRLVWASSTDVREKDDLGRAAPFNARVIERNRIAAGIASKEGIEVDDLYSLVKDHPEWHAKDGVHFNQEGVKAQATQVSAALKEALAKMRP